MLFYLILQMNLKKLILPMTDKNDNAYKSIGEVAKILNLVNKKNGKLNTHQQSDFGKIFYNYQTQIFFLVIEDIMTINLFIYSKK